MSVKQDRVNARTPADLERKYDLGSMGDRFGEIMGIALDAQTHSEAAMDAIEQTNGVVAEISERVDAISITVKDLDNVTSAEFLIGIINGESTAKISADKLDIAGKKLNIKVDATNIEGRLKIGQLPTSVVDTATLETGVTTIVNGMVTTDFVNALGITAKYLDVEDLSALGATIGGWTINTSSLSGSRTGGLGETYETQLSRSALKFSETATSGKETSVALTSNGIVLHKESLYGVTNKFCFLTLYLADGIGVELYVDQYGVVSGKPFGSLVTI